VVDVKLLSCGRCVCTVGMFRGRAGSIYKALSASASSHHDEVKGTGDLFADISRRMERIVQSRVCPRLINPAIMAL
jgi:hypothetical protein